MEKIKCVIFDADGMVINSEVFSVQLEKDYGISNDIMLPFFKGPFQECIVGKADLKKEIAPFIKKGGWKYSVDKLLDYWFKVQHKLDDRIIKETKRLREKGVRCYLASNQEKYRAEYIRVKFGKEFSALSEDSISEITKYLSWKDEKRLYPIVSALLHRV